MKIHPVGAESFHVNRKTDVTKLKVVFRNCANLPRNESEKVMVFIELKRNKN